MKNFFENSVVKTFMRSQVHPADYNPRKIDDEGRKRIKASIKRFGVVGGIVVNEQTDNTIVGGHQKIFVLDEINHYDPETHENDYEIRADAVNVDLTREKELNILLNNPKVGGDWDWDKLREIMPDVDYKAVGFDEADLNMIGVDFMLQTEVEASMADELESLMRPVNEQHQAEAQARREERMAAREAEREVNAQMEREARIAHMKDVKQQVREGANEKALNLDAYVTISFDTFKAKAAFCERFGYDAYTKFLKGEVFSDQVERIE